MDSECAVLALFGSAVVERINQKERVGKDVKQGS